MRHQRTSQEYVKNYSIQYLYQSMVVKKSNGFFFKVRLVALFCEVLFYENHSGKERYFCECIYKKINKKMLKIDLTLHTALHLSTY